MKTQNRPLTQEELDIAWSLDWNPTHYRVTDSEVLFESNTKWMAQGIRFPLIKRGPYSQKSKLTKCTPIPQKPFDIESVVWSDNDVAGVIVVGTRLETHMENGWYLIETKQDIINKAKALGVTPEDLK